MELVIDKKQIGAARQWAQDLASDRVRLRFAVCLVMVVLGWMLVLKPQADALAAARTSLGKAHTQAKRATDAVFYTNQVERYEPYLFTDDDPVFLENKGRVGTSILKQRVSCGWRATCKAVAN